MNAAKGPGPRSCCGFAGGPNLEVIGGVAALGVIGAITASQSGSGSKAAPKVCARNSLYGRLVISSLLCDTPGLWRLRQACTGRMQVLCRTLLWGHNGLVHQPSRQQRRFRRQHQRPLEVPHAFQRQSSPKPHLQAAPGSLACSAPQLVRIATVYHCCPRNSLESSAGSRQACSEGYQLWTKTLWCCSQERQSRR